MKTALIVFAWLILAIGLFTAFVISLEAPSNIGIAWGLAGSSVVTSIFFGAMAAIIDRLETIAASLRSKPSKTIEIEGRSIELRASIADGNWTAKAYENGERLEYGWLYSLVSDLPSEAIETLELKLREHLQKAQARKITSTEG